MKPLSRLSSWPPCLACSASGLALLKPSLQACYTAPQHMWGLNMSLGYSCPRDEHFMHRSGSYIFPPQPGHTISIDCQDCICKEATLTCQKKACPQPTCPEPGFVPVPVALEAGQCCPQFSCGEPLLLSPYPWVGLS
jgi:hypothetical protein